MEQIERYEVSVREYGCVAGLFVRVDGPAGTIEVDAAELYDLLKRCGVVPRRVAVADGGMCLACGMSGCAVKSDVFPAGGNASGCEAL